MQRGIFVPNFGEFGSARALAELAQLAEECGWEGFFIWDHIARPVVIEMADPWIALAAIATSTAKIRFGALVTPLPRRRPWKVARETVTLDHLSQGRLVFGVGTGGGGGAQAEWAALAEETDLRARGAMLDEGLAVLAGLWSGEEFSHTGAHYNIGPSRFLPPPLQRPRIPVWVAGVWPNRKPFRRAAQWDGVFPLSQQSPFVEPDELRAILALIRGERTATSPFDVAVGGMSADAANGARLAALRDAGATWWLEWAKPAPGELARIRARIRSGPPR